jgi:hypothetical protein
MSEVTGLQREINEIMSRHTQAQEPQVEAPKVEERPVQQAPEQQEIKEVKQEVVAEEDELIEFVDDEQQQIETQPQTIELFTSILPEAKSVDDVKNYIKQVDEERLKYKVQAEDKWANEKVRQLNDYVKSGGDIDNYLSRKETIRQYDHQIEAVKGIDPIEAVKFNLKAQGVSEDLIEAYVDNTPEVNLRIEGTKIINQEVQALISGKTQLEQQEAVELEQLTAKRERFQSELNAQADKIAQVLNVKVSEKDRQHLKESVKDAHQVLRKYFPVDESGNFKADTFMENVALLELGRKYASQLRKMATGNGERKVFDKLQNIPQQQSSPKVAQDVKPDSAKAEADGVAVYEALRKAVSMMD